MSSIIISPAASGAAQFTIAAPATATNRVITLPDATDTLVGAAATQTLTNKTISGGTVAQMASQASTSGTSIDFTGIPSWAKKITVMLQGVSTSGTSPVVVQIGSTTFTTSGYVGTSVVISSATIAASTTNGFQVFLNNSDTAAAARNGIILIANITGNAWVGSVSVSLTGGAASCVGAGSVSLSGVLDRVRITTSGGTDTFDAGTINILYEG